MSFMNKIFLPIIGKILSRLMMEVYNSLFFGILLGYFRALLDYEHMILVFGRNFFS